MKPLFSIPTGYHLRELVMPLHEHLEQDAAVEKVFAVTPGAAYREQIFEAYSQKFEFHTNPEGIEKHKELLEQLNPDVVITNTVGHDPLDYPILKAGQELGIKTVTFIASWDNVWKIGRLLKAGTPVAVADHIIVWNEMMKDLLLRLFPDVSADRVAVIGAPRLDYFWHTDKLPSKEAVYRFLGFSDTNRPLIHFATTELYPMGYIVEAVREAIDAGRIVGNPYLYASVHPGGNMERHRPLEKYGVTVRYSFGRQESPILPEFSYLPTEADLYMLTSLFIHASVLVNHSSTTALESLIGRTPVINVKYGRPLDWWHWYRSMVYRDFKQHYVDLVKDGATRIVTNKHQLISTLRRVLENPSMDETARQGTIKRMITTVDGTASEKLIRHIKDLTSA